jgi:hypothetical protein
MATGLRPSFDLVPSFDFLPSCDIVSDRKCASTCSDSSMTTVSKGYQPVAVLQSLEAVEAEGGPRASRASPSSR